MSKAHRGAGIRKEHPNQGRGTCPVCKRSGVKLLYEQTVDDKKVNVCKACDAHIKNVAASAKPAAAEAAAPAAEN
ncbi:MAG: hypothetical protein SPL79_03925 [Sphaerochaetaceae bacterium]|nr:hypothetical protein [Spirochaetaceae bacterium]MDY6343427.1 hypothetical protein [Sphaerochaetaceae bacterium]